MHARSSERRSRETRETRAAARDEKRCLFFRASPISRLQSHAWSFACLARFVRWTKKKERLLVVKYIDLAEAKSEASIFFTFNYLKRITFNLCKSTNQSVTDFKTERENYESNSITVIGKEFLPIRVYRCFSKQRTVDFSFFLLWWIRPNIGE